MISDNQTLLRQAEARIAAKDFSGALELLGTIEGRDWSL
jgi:hypothetical protein